MWLGGLYTDNNTDTDANSDTDPDNDGQSMIVWALWLINQVTKSQIIKKIGLLDLC